MHARAMVGGGGIQRLGPEAKTTLNFGGAPLLNLRPEIFHRVAVVSCARRRRKILSQTYFRDFFPKNYIQYNKRRRA